MEDGPGEDGPGKGARGKRPGACCSRQGEDGGQGKGARGQMDRGLFFGARGKGPVLRGDVQHFTCTNFFKLSQEPVASKETAQMFVASRQERFSRLQVNSVLQVFVTIFNGPKRPQDGSKVAQDGPRGCQHDSKIAPRRLREGLKEAQDNAKAPQDSQDSQANVL